MNLLAPIVTYLDPRKRVSPTAPYPALILFFLICMMPQNILAQSSDNAKTIPPVISFLLEQESEISILSSTIVSEGDSGITSIDLLVQVSPYTESSVNVEILANSTAQLGSDYNAPALSPILFSNGLDQVVLSFDILGDNTTEAAESFTVRLFDTANAKLSTQDSATVTIIDDDSLYNDTGVQIAANPSGGLNADCTSTSLSEQQDCSNGRDAKAAAGTLAKLGSGVAGFDFTKLGANGQALAIQNGTYSATGNEADGTQWSCVRDNNTGLVWEVKTPTGARGKDIEYRWGGLSAIARDHPDREGAYFDDWNNLVNTANFGTGLCGRTDWHVPSAKALSSILYYGDLSSQATSLPTIDTDYFPNTASNTYWSASPHPIEPFFIEFPGGVAWQISFSNDPQFNLVQQEAAKIRSTSNRVRLVSGTHEPISNEIATAANPGQVVKNYLPNTTPNDRYIVGNNSTTVVDTNSSLMWQRCLLGLSGVDCTNGTLSQLSWSDTLLAAQNSTVGGFTDWRVPSVAELRTLTAYDRQEPSINSFIFPNTQAGSTTATPYITSQNGDSIFEIGSIFGSVLEASRGSNTHTVRLVRGGID